jgi:restriction system protein
MQRLRDLARLRATHVPPGYTGIGDYHGGAYDCQHVSPYTKTAGNLDSDVMLILQDWCSSKFLEEPLREHVRQLGYDPCLPTNSHLVDLLHDHLGRGLADVYVTNLFPFVKPGAMSSTIPAPDLRKAAIDFALPQIRIVEPRLVIVFGAAAFNALRCGVGLERVRDLPTAIASPFEAHGATLWCQSHPGALGRANRGVLRVHEDWQQMCARACRPRAA